ncbi:MAG: tetratricopeptide repeat protein [Candidatus Ratteibacteria bacterium]
MSKKYIIFLILITFLGYLNSIFNPFIWDDYQLIIENPYIRSFKNFRFYFTTDLFRGKTSNFYRPLQTIFYSLIYKIFKLNPIPYHLLNIFLHIGCCLLFFILLKDIYGEKLSFLASILWAIHPINTEAITYISGTADPLFLFFGLLSIYLYNKNLKFLSYISFIFSLLSKETGILILPLFFLYQYSINNLKKEKIPEYALITLLFLIYLILRKTVLNFGKAQPEEIFIYRFFTSFKAFLVYISILIFPFILSMERHIPYIKKATDIDFIGGFILFLLILYFLWKKRREKKILFALSLFIGNFIFHSNTIIPLNGNLREHWMYLGGIGFFIIFLILFDYIKKERFKFALIIFVFSLYGVRTILRNYDWKDPEKFYLKSVKYSFYPSQLYGNLCYFYIRNGDYEKSYQISKYIISRGLKNESILYVFGISCLNLKKYKEAEKSFYEVLKLNPENYEAYTELGELYYLKGEFEKSKKFLKRSMELNQEYPKTYYILSKIYIIENNVEKLNECVDKLSQLVPDDFYPYYLKGMICKLIGNYEEANKNFNKSLSILKNKKDFNSLLNLGILYRESGKIDKAINLFYKLKELNPENLEILNEIGICYALKGDKEKAKKIWEEILKKNPEYYPAKENLKRLNI